MENRVMRRTIALLLCLFLCAAIAFAGGQQDEAAVPEELKVLACSWPTMDLVIALTPDFEADTGIKVTYESVPYPELQSKMQVALSATRRASFMKYSSQLGRLVDLIFV